MKYIRLFYRKLFQDPTGLQTSSAGFVCEEMMLTMILVCDNMQKNIHSSSDVNYFGRYMYISRYRELRQWSA